MQAVASGKEQTAVDSLTMVSSIIPKDLCASCEQQLRLIQHLPAVICELDSDGTTLFVNDAVTQMSGYGIDELLGKNWWDIFFPGERRQQVNDLYLRFYAEGDVANHEMFPLAKDGTPRTISWTSSNQWLADGTVARIVGIGINITERKRAEQSLRESEARYRTLFETSPDAIVEVGLDLKIQMANRQAALLLGMESPEQLIGEPSSRFIAPDEIQRSWQNAHNVLSAGTHSGIEHTLIRKDGSPVPVEISGSLVKDAAGNPQAIIAVLRDVTKRKRAEEALRQSETRQTFLLRSFPIALYSSPTTVDSAATWITDQVEQITGFPALTFTQDPTLWLSRIHPHDRDRVVAQSEASRDHGVLVTEYRWKCADGTYRWFLDQNMLVHEVGGTSDGLIGTWMDITERKLAAEELQGSLDKLHKVLESTIQAMALTVEMRDPYTAGHQQRVAELAFALATEMGLPEERTRATRLAALIHDIGKINVPAEILSKPGQISELEFSLIKAHSELGYDILKRIDFPWPIAQIVLQHHERLNGSGYPRGLAGQDILLEARILGVADVVEAMASHRPYRPSLGIDAALREIALKRGVLYDPQVVDACRRLFADQRFRWT